MNVTRAVAQHTIRPVESLCGQWDFAVQKGDYGPPRAYRQKIPVPSCWETLPGLENFRGRAWFRRRITVRPGLAPRLVFGGVSHTGTVYVDGRKVGWHYDAFTPWAITVPRLKPGTHELAVEVDNSFGSHSALHIENDYYTYGGITRPVEVQHVPEVYLDAIFAAPRPLRGGWRLDIRVRLKNRSRRRLTRRPRQPNAPQW